MQASLGLFTGWTRSFAYPQGEWGCRGMWGGVGGGRKRVLVERERYIEACNTEIAVDESGLKKGGGEEGEGVRCWREVEQARSILTSCRVHFQTYIKTHKKPKRRETWRPPARASGTLKMIWLTFCQAPFLYLLILCLLESINKSF